MRLARDCIAVAPTPDVNISSSERARGFSPPNGEKMIATR